MSLTVKLFGIKFNMIVVLLSITLGFLICSLTICSCNTMTLKEGLELFTNIADNFTLHSCVAKKDMETCTNTYGYTILGGPHGSGCIEANCAAFDMLKTRGSNSTTCDGIGV